MPELEEALPLGNYLFHQGQDYNLFGAGGRGQGNLVLGILEEQSVLTETLLIWQRTLSWFI